MREFITLIENTLLSEVTLSKYGPGQKFLISGSKDGKNLSTELNRQGVDTTGYVELIDPKTATNPKATLQIGRGDAVYAFKNDKGQIWIVTGTTTAIQPAFTHYYGAGGDDGESAKVANRGEISEGILGAAMFAKFTKRVGHEDLKVVTPEDISQVLAQLKQTAQDVYQTTVQDANSRVADTVTFVLKLKTAPYRDLMDPAKRQLLAKEFASAAAYVNTPMAERYSKYFYLNGKADTINVVADGAASETERKTDVWVQVKDPRTGEFRTLKLNASLKVGGIKQFGQVGGSDMATMVKLWNYFGINVSPYVDNYMKQAESDKFTALEYMYKNVADKLAEYLRGDHDTEEAKFVDIIAHAITFFATLGEKNVELVDFSKGGFKILRFNKLAEKLREVDLTATYLGHKSRPEISIHDVNNPKKYLLNIRVKIETRESGDHYVRNVIEKGPLLDDIAKVQQGYWDDSTKQVSGTKIKVPRQKR